MFCMTSVYNIMNPGSFSAANCTALMGAEAAAKIPDIRLSLDSYIDIMPAIFPRDTKHAARLFSEYSAYLLENDPSDTSADEIMREIDVLPRLYGPPEGMLIMARAGEEVLGCGCWVRKSNDWCEGKRMFVKPCAAGMGIGKAMLANIISSARAAGFQKLRLDTLASLKSAVGLYRSFGFKEIDPYFYADVADTIFMELKL